MKKSLLLLFFFLYGIHALFAQQLKINNGSTSVNKPDKYAVVIGISDYQNKDIPDLRFAHKDAEAFVAYLRSPSGGNLQNNQLKVLLNENATTAQIAAALEWLVEVGKEGDQAIIYFSGHGDVETKTMFQLGYLLTWDSPPKTYVAGAFPLSYLQAIVSTLALQNKTEVTLITDACRAGKLAGTAVGGAQITNANLSKQFANEVKILSCQPDEFSIEGEQWGGGRGAFSYHLIDGLYGLADENEDLQVNLFEIGRYLEDKVSKETDPHSQFPMILGSKNTLMASVDEQILLQLKEKRKRETPVLATIESKGFEEMSLAGVDSVWQQKYQDFIAALETGHLLDAPNEQPSAYELYLELSTINELKALHGTMQRNLASALQDEAQQTINAYLAANPAEMKKRYDAETDYGRYPRYLQKAAELLGEQNFYYPFIMAKLLYFEGLQLRLAVENNTDKKATYQQAIDKQLEALEYQEHAPFVLNELGVLHTRLFQDEKAFDYYKKAIALAPEWGLPYVNYCIGLFYTGQYDKSLEYGEKALEYLPQFPQMYNFLAWIYANDYAHLDKQYWTRKGLELSDDTYFWEGHFNTLSQNIIRYQKAIDLLERAKKVDSTYYPTFRNLGTIYYQSNMLDKAEEDFKKAIELDSTDEFSQGQLGWVYTRQLSLDKAEKAFLKSIEVAKSEWQASQGYNRLGYIYGKKGNVNKMIETYEKAIELDPRNKLPYINQANQFISLGEYKKAENILLDVLKTDPTHLQSYDGLGTLYQHLNRPGDVEYICLKGLELKPNYLPAMNALINHYTQTAQHQKALEWQQKRMEIVPNDPVTHIDDLNTFEFTNKEAIYYPENCLNLAKYYKKQQEPERAKFLYKKIIEIRPDTLSALWAWSLAEAYLKLGQLEKARAIYADSIDLEKPAELLAAGKLFYLQGKREKSIIYFEKYIAQLEGKKKAYLDIGNWYHIHSESDVAERYLKNALAKDSAYLEAYRSLAEVYFINHKKVQAIALLDQVIKSQPSEEFVALLNDIKVDLEYLFGNLAESLNLSNKVIEVYPAYQITKSFITKRMENDLEGATAIMEKFDEAGSNAWVGIILCQLKIEQGDLEAGMQLLEVTLTYEGLSYDFLNEDPKLAPIRKMPRYKELMGQYFPEKIK